MLILLLFLQLSTFTHYSKKDASGKVVPCGTVEHFKGGWRVHLEETGTHSQILDTQAEAVAWIKPYCPIEDK